MVAEAAGQRSHQFGPVGREVGATDQTAPLAHQVHQGGGHRPPVEAGLPQAGDAPEGGGELRLSERFARLQGPQSMRG